MNNAHILLVEDNEMDIVLTLDAFRENRLVNDIQVVKDGEEALNYIFGKNEFSDRDKYPMPDLILLDLNMPKVNGFDVLKKIKSTPIIKRIPIIILTSSKDEGDRILGYDEGANSYLVKPISFDGFLQVVKKVTEYWVSLNIPSPIE
jgi:CheY-like chemotaxis protein